MAIRDDIHVQVRRLTRSPSEQQLAESVIDSKINTFLTLYFPNFFELFSLRKTFSFYTYPNIDKYYTNPDSTAVGQMADFKNINLSVDTPVYIQGYLGWFTMRREEFFAWVNTVQKKKTIASGDGITSTFTGTLDNIPVESRSVIFSSVDVNGIAVQLIDRPLISDTSPTEGVELTEGNLYSTRTTIPDFPTTQIATNTINYVTGAYTITFDTIPASGTEIKVQTIPYKASQPRSVLFFDNTLLSVPSQMTRMK